MPLRNRIFARNACLCFYGGLLDGVRRGLLAGLRCGMAHTDIYLGLYDYHNNFDHSFNYHHFEFHLDHSDHDVDNDDHSFHYHHNLHNPYYYIDLDNSYHNPYNNHHHEHHAYDNIDHHNEPHDDHDQRQYHNHQRQHDDDRIWRVRVQLRSVRWTRLDWRYALLRWLDLHTGRPILLAMSAAFRN